MNNQVCRWGILSAAEIAKKTGKRLLEVAMEGLSLLPRGSKSIGKDFIDFCQRSCPVDVQPEALEGYDRLLERTDIDAVYIPLPTAIRGDGFAKQSLRGQTRVSREPAEVHSDQLRPLIQLASERKSPIHGWSDVHAFTTLASATNCFGRSKSTWKAKANCRSLFFLWRR